MREGGKKKHLKGLAQANIIKKSVILFWLVNTVYPREKCDVFS